MIALIPVDSSAIRAVGYFGGILTVEFTSGRTYHHPGVPYWVFAGLLLASSKGAFYNAYVKGRYR
jgi:hypothetical protein